LEQRGGRGGSGDGSDEEEEEEEERVFSTFSSKAYQSYSGASATYMALSTAVTFFGLATRALGLIIAAGSWSFGYRVLTATTIFHTMLSIITDMEPIDGDDPELLPLRVGRDKITMVVSISSLYTLLPPALFLPSLYICDPILYLHTFIYRAISWLVGMMV